jgi:hypothetical protein
MRERHRDMEQEGEIDRGMGAWRETLFNLNIVIYECKILDSSGSQ